MVWLSTFLIVGLVVGTVPQTARAAEQAASLSELATKLHINPKQISVSGISSGGFMAHQLHVAHSQDVMGAGIIAGGPYNCAQGSLNRAMLQCTAFMAQGICAFLDGSETCRNRLYDGPGPGPDGKASIAAVNMASLALSDTLTARTAIDDPRGILGDKIVLLRGSKDKLVPEGVSDALEQYYRMVYRHFAQPVPAKTITYVKELGANHAVTTTNTIGLKPPYINRCDVFGQPFLSECSQRNCSTACAADTLAVQGSACSLCREGIDAAGVILEKVYGTLQPSNAPKVTEWRLSSPPTVVHDCRRGGTVDPRCQWLQERIYAFSQSEVFGGSSLATDASFMESKGFIFVPKRCKTGASCKLHIAFHGCQQGYNFHGYNVVKAMYSGPESGWPHFVENAGYNEWADANDIVVLYPQALTANLGAANPQGCWDFWGYTDKKYATKSGRQIGAVWRMVERLVPAVTAR